MKEFVKKILVREGLIIISLAFLGLICFLTRDYITVGGHIWSIDPLTESKFVIETRTGEKFTVVLNKGNLTEKEIDELVDLKKQRAKENLLSARELNESGFSIVKTEVQTFKRKDMVKPIILFGYPIYLFIQIVLWAIRALRENKKTGLIKTAIKISD